MKHKILSDCGVSAAAAAASTAPVAATNNPSTNPASASSAEDTEEAAAAAAAALIDFADCYDLLDVENQGVAPSMDQSETPTVIPFRSRCNTWPRQQQQQVSAVVSAGVGVPMGASSQATAAETFPQQEAISTIDFSVLMEPDQGESKESLTKTEQPQEFPFFGQVKKEDTSSCRPMEVVEAASPLAEAKSPSVKPSFSPPMTKKPGARRNPWGNLSYADLITQAIQSSPDQRLTLAQIYEWLVKNVPYFHGKGDSVSSIGWKVRSACSIVQ